jgi:nitroreductase
VTPLDEILDLARWAPSGDNSQPWRFEIVAPDHVVVHAFDTRTHCVYDLDGRASQLAVGALLETIRIAATLHGMTLRIVRRAEAPDELPLIDVWLERGPDVVADPLANVIRERSVQRGPLSTSPLDVDMHERLEGAAGPGFRVVWFEGWRQRTRMAWLATRSAKIRLTTPEAYAVHREIIEWGARFSEDRVPDQALGADPLAVRSMRWTLASWKRVRMMNRFFAGTYLPRIQLDLLPGLRCGAHFALLADAPAADIDRCLAAGAAVQRFWLTCTALGLQLQPQYTPLVFADYARRGVRFTCVEKARDRALAVAALLDRRLGPEGARCAVFLGRIGRGAPARSRSLRLPLERLRWSSETALPGRPAAP